MLTTDTLPTEAQRTLKRLLTRYQSRLKVEPGVFAQRLSQHWPTIFDLLYRLYGQNYDFFYTLEIIFETMIEHYNARPDDLHALDHAREQTPLWFQSEQMVGGVCYVDLFAGSLRGVEEKIPYFKELGLTYLHLMPLFKTPEGENDGGYAISDFRQVNPALGTMEELAELGRALRAEGISLVLDFVFNHTSSEHAWARAALAGDPDYQDFYFFFPDRTLPDQYERTLREVFPEQAPGNFTYLPEAQRWVWTTFREFQWDLNYRNPLVFNAMLGELLFLANQGVEVMRLDAVAFIWKELGTVCEGLPQAHWIIQAYNAIVRVVAPAMLFKSEAIVHPDVVASYIGTHESPISYNPTLMALLWEAAATRDTTLLSYSMQKRYDLPPGCAWINYVRCHDDIGWTFADEDARAVGIDGYWHRQFLNKFYIGAFEGSFARGVPFNYNPINHDMRISGMAASLIGLEQALELNNDLYIDHALKRLLLLHSVILSAGGIPLIYLGDEIAMLNDYSYMEDEAKRIDSRWVHRPRFDWARAATRHDPTTHAGWMFTHLTHLIAIRKQTPAFGAGRTRFFWSGSRHVLSYIVGESVVVVANFSEHPQTIDGMVVGAFAQVATATDLVTGEILPAHAPLTLRPLQFRWMQTRPQEMPTE